MSSMGEDTGPVPSIRQGANFHVTQVPAVGPQTLTWANSAVNHARSVAAWAAGN